MMNRSFKKCVAKKILAVAIVLPFVLAMAKPAEAKTYWKRGMAIGAGAGAVAVGTALGIVGASMSCDEIHLLPCGSKGGLVWGIGGAVNGALIGMGIGALVGSMIKVKDEVTIMPIVVPRKDGISVGMGIAKTF